MYFDYFRIFESYSRLSLLLVTHPVSQTHFGTLLVYFAVFFLHGNSFYIKLRLPQTKNSVPFEFEITRLNYKSIHFIHVKSADGRANSANPCHTAPLDIGFYNIIVQQCLLSFFHTYIKTLVMCLSQEAE